MQVTRTGPELQLERGDSTRIYKNHSYRKSSVFLLVSYSKVRVKTRHKRDNLLPRGPFLESPGNLRARKDIFSSSVSKNREVCTPKASCIKGTSGHIKNTWIKQLCDHKVWDFATAFRVRKLFGTFEKRAPGPSPSFNLRWWLVTAIFELKGGENSEKRLLKYSRVAASNSHWSNCYELIHLVNVNQC